MNWDVEYFQGNLGPDTPEARAYLEGLAKFRAALHKSQQRPVPEDGEQIWFVGIWGVPFNLGWMTGRLHHRNTQPIFSTKEDCKAHIKDMEHPVYGNWYRMVRPF